MLTRRLQILLDDDRYDRLAREATRRDVPVARVVRDALDRFLPSPSARRQSAATAILAADPMRVPEPEELRRELDDLRAPRG